tara:strand:+ start:224 stop:469 length:246 start_codon:yes stop_codon:yes gene_type:complete
MNLDETILQSNTCINLIMFIEDLMTLINSKNFTDINNHQEFIDDYKYLIRKYKKALNKRDTGVDFLRKFEESFYKENKIGG